MSDDSVFSDPWFTPERQRAAEVTADPTDRREWQEIAEEIGITTRTLYEWRIHPVFMEAVKKLRESRFEFLRQVGFKQLMRNIQNESDASLKLLFNLIGDQAGDVVNQINIVNEREKLSDADLERRIEERQKMLEQGEP